MFMTLLQPNVLHGSETWPLKKPKKPEISGIRENWPIGQSLVPKPNIEEEVTS